MFGYPGVSYLDSGGAQVGQPATRSDEGEKAALVSLEPQDEAHFVVQNSHVAPQPGCEAVGTAASIKVYPPDQTAALILSSPAPEGFLVCNPVVTPVRAGAGGR